MQNATPGVGHILYDKGYVLQSHEEEIKEIENNPPLKSYELKYQNSFN